MKDTKIALVQMQSLLNKKLENLKKIKEYIDKACDNKVDIICFPEACVNGYSKNSNPINSKEKDDLLYTFSKISVNNGITIILGYIEENKDKLPYITQMINTPDGKTNYYRKSHLGKSEVGYFSRGNDIPVFKTPTANIGIQICWETHFPELSTIMGLKGADIIFTPFASPLDKKKRKEVWAKYLPARAYDNSLFLGACNSNRALAIDPKGNIIQEDFHQGEDIVYVTLEAKLIKNIRDEKNSSMSARHYIKHRRPDLYKDILQDFKFKEL